MSFLDIVIIVLLFVQAGSWARKGLINGVFSLAGFWAGIVAGLLLAPFAVQLANSGVTRFLVVLLVIFIMASIGIEISAYLGRKLSGVSERFKLGKLDSVLGASFGVMLTLVIIWLFAALIGGTPLRALNEQVRQSAIIQGMNERLPPAPDLLTKIAAIADSNGFPKVFDGLEPRPIAPVSPPSSEEVARAQQAAARSTVRIVGSGCGGTVFGSGFVAANDLVVTNAHVVSGISSSSIEDVSGRHAARVVVYDPDLDIAVLRTSRLAGAPLKIANSVQPRGTTGAVLGYPGGGPLKVSSMAVLRDMQARGRNIYGDKIVSRDIYELQAEIREGDSGGPIVNADGTVIGVTFARSLSTENNGYAITSPEVLPLINAAQSRVAPVSTGACAKD